MRITLSLFVLLGFVISTGCQANSVPQPVEPPSTVATDSLLTPGPGSPTQRATAMAQLPPTQADADLQSLIEKAKADLIKQFAIHADQIQVVEARAVTWPNASLGCPQPGQDYAQVLIPGYWVLLEAEGRQYPYHADRAEKLILCMSAAAGLGTEMPLFPPIPVNPTEIKDGEPWVPVN